VRPRTHRIINEFSWGGYLAWRLHDDSFEVLLDGRTQLFSPEFWEEAYLRGGDETSRFIRSIDADAAVLPITGSRFAEALIGSGWREVYLDDRARVLVPPPGQGGG
jgi:hypothetical protein